MTKRLDDAKSHIKQAIGSVLHYLSKDEQQSPEIIAVMFRATCEKIGELGHDPRRAAKVFLTKLRGMASLDGLAIGIGDMISLFSVTVDGRRGLISRASGEMSVRCNKCGKVRTFTEDNLKEAVAHECCGETMGKKVAMRLLSSVLHRKISALLVAELTKHKDIINDSIGIGDEVDLKNVVEYQDEETGKVTRYAKDNAIEEDMDDIFNG